MTRWVRSPALLSTRISNLICASLETGQEEARNCCLDQQASGRSRRLDALSMIIAKIGTGMHRSLCRSKTKVQAEHGAEDIHGGVNLNRQSPPKAKDGSGDLARWRTDPPVETSTRPSRGDADEFGRAKVGPGRPQVERFRRSRLCAPTPAVR